MYNVLIVDDEPGALKSIRYLLDWERTGFVVAGEASNGRQALDRLRERSYSLVITDIRMPVMDGMALIAALREFADIPVAIMSGYEDFAHARTALQYGVKDYLLKPTEAEELERLLASVKRELDEKGGVSREGGPDTPAGAAEFVKRWVKEHYGEPVSMKGIASQLYMNAAYLGSLFKAQTGIGFNDYVLRVRMEKAKELLEGTDMKVYEVASAVGYQDMDWFYEKFKQYTGVNPGDYRSRAGGSSG
ncbi:response regulator transcription factor [Paenibacillus flagellatus]|uniref:DNA-binding response regulator n=1 Tax=Paenibacillus flagellatus TaxID=2211139 RepID=A0A2V5KC17_9BACL|nr:response regulator [Paenibacillus flagellatus]PYI57125.1 DNA-binding response regulator [Paenibacillus flagellatus]